MSPAVLIRRTVLALGLCLALVACSDSPADVVEKDFLSVKRLSGSEFKAQIQAQAQEAYDLAYKEVLAEDRDPESEEARKFAAEEAAKDRDTILAPYKNFDDAAFEKAAKTNREVYSGAKIRITDTKIDGKNATVGYEIVYRDGLKEKASRKLKQSNGKWILLPPEEVAAEDGDAEKNTETAE